MATDTPTNVTAYLLRSVGYVPIYWLLRFIFDRWVFQAVAGSAIASAQRKKAEKQPVRQQQLDKFTESLWKASVYMYLHACTWHVLWNKPWLRNPDNFWRLDGQDGLTQRHYGDVERLYDVHTGFYLTSVLMLLFWETRRKDFPVMMAHHFVTIGLLAGSYAVGYTRVGSVILLLHDPSDIALEISKLFNYGGKSKLANVAFIGMMISWLYLRLYLFPFYVIRSCMFGAQHVIGRPVDHWWPFNALLCALVVMHLYWGFLILKVALTVIKGNATDVREEEE